MQWANPPPAPGTATRAETVNAKRAKRAPATLTVGIVATEFAGTPNRPAAVRRIAAIAVIISAVEASHLGHARAIADIAAIVFADPMRVPTRAHMTAPCAATIFVV